MLINRDSQIFNDTHKSFLLLTLLLLCLTLVVGSTGEIATANAPADHPGMVKVIVQGQDLERVAAAVRSVGGTITHALGIIYAVGASLTEDQRQELEKHDRVTRTYDDSAAQTNSEGKGPYVVFPSLIDADDLHNMGIDGRGITVAVVDSGILLHPERRDFQHQPLGAARIILSKPISI